MKPPAPTRRDRLRAMLADLRMPGALEAIDGILSEVDGGAISAAEAIEQLLGAQIELRNNRRLKAAMRSSRLPAVKTLAQFDFAFQPSIKREQIESLHELGFVDRRENVILLGPPGPSTQCTPRYVIESSAVAGSDRLFAGRRCADRRRTARPPALPGSPRALPCTLGRPRSCRPRSAAVRSSC